MGTATFAACLAFTLRFEGGKVDDPRDPGGRTNQGITQRSYALWRARKGLASRDVYAMEAAERDAIYRVDYWDAVKADSLAVGVDLAVFDFAVNSGPARAAAACAAAQGADPSAAVKAICARRLSFLQSLQTFKTFGRGWSARVAACEALGVRMAEQARIGRSATADIPEPQVASRLQAESAVAHAQASKHGTVAAVTAGAAAAAAPVAATNPHLSWTLLAGAAFVLLAGIGLALWKAHQGRARGKAYAAAATIV